MTRNSGAALPRDLHLSQKPESPVTKHSYHPGAVVGNGGLSFAGRRGGSEEPNPSVLATFGHIMKHLKEGTPYQALSALNKLAVIWDQVGEKELWHALSALSDVAMGKKADSAVRVGALEMLELIYPRAISRKMERLDKGKSIERSFGEEEEAQTGLPQRKIDVDSLLATFIADTGENGDSFGSSEAEVKMASAILSIVFSEDNTDRAVDEAAFRAFNNIDSPILTEMITSGANPYKLGGSCFKLDEPGEEPIPLVNGREPQKPETLEELDIEMRL